MAASGTKRSKNQLRREKLKQRKLEDKNNNNTKNEEESIKNDPSISSSSSISSKIEIPNEEHTLESNINITTDNPLFEQFQSIFNKFNKDDESIKETTIKSNSISNEVIQSQNSDSSSSDDDEDDNSDDEEYKHQQKQLSKRQLRIQNKIPLGKLKSFSKFPQIVDIHDIDSKDPYLLISIKSQPNIIPVPINWSSKRDYLSSKRGIEKLPFQLPKYIQATGISEMRSSDDDKDSKSNLRKQQRERVQPKMGKLDMDYEKLYDAFYKFQTKPRLFSYGELFEEGKESNDELILKILKIKPGIISKNLKIALGMPIEEENIPPAWITIMKDIGKPPSYRDLIIPGLDIGYSNTGYKDKNSDSKRKNFKHWGRLNVLDESSDEDEDDDVDDVDEEEEEEEEGEGEEEQEEVEKEKEEETKSKDEPTLNDILSGLSAGNEDINEKSKEDKKLYKVLKETKLQSDDSSITGHTYDLQNYNKTKIEKQSDNNETNEQQEDEFKF